MDENPPVNRVQGKLPLHIYRPNCVERDEMTHVFSIQILNLKKVLGSQLSKVHAQNRVISNIKIFRQDPRNLQISDTERKPSTL